MKIRVFERRGLMRAALAVTLALLIAPASFAWWNHRPGNSPCEAIARKVLIACQNAAYSDYFIALAKAENLTDGEERAEARDEAREELKEALRECREQFSARLDLCEELDEERYAPDLDPERFCLPIDNPYLPMVPGTSMIYEAETDEGTEQIVVTVLDETIEIAGVTCQVVQDTVFLDGVPVEDTYDWFVKDIDGNVWYFGENSISFEDGEIASLEGSWKTGEDGALAGIVMLADPQVGDVYRQEYLIGEAEDAGRVIELGATAETPYGTFTNCLVTADFSPLEPDALEHKYYAPGVGLVLEVNPEDDERVELVDIITP
jgi:hypothetical protein